MVNASDETVRAGFQVLGPTTDRGPIVGHVPHSAVAIPREARDGLLLDEAALDAELVAVTDWDTDRLYAWIRDLGGSLFVNRVSRLVVDPERFADDALEPMARVGRGAVYTRTVRGLPLRAPDPAGRAWLLDRWFAPYHAALSTLVGEALDAFDRCLVIDGHSFSSVPLPSEPDQDPDRPDVCLGTDPFHTPRGLAAPLCAALEAQGFRVAIDRPFTGALVPMRWYRRDPRVAAVMLEVRRGIYCDEATGKPLPAFEDVVARLRRAVAVTLEGGGWTIAAVG